MFKAGILRQLPIASRSRYNALDADTQLTFLHQLCGQNCLLGLEACVALTHARHQRETGLSVKFTRHWPIRRSFLVCTLSQAHLSVRDALSRRNSIH